MNEHMAHMLRYLQSLGRTHTTLVHNGLRTQVSISELLAVNDA